MKVTLRKRPPGPLAAVWTAGGLAAAVLAALAGVAYSGAGQERLLSDPGAIVVGACHRFLPCITSHWPPSPAL